MKRTLKLLLTVCVLMNMFVSIGFVPVLAGAGDVCTYNGTAYPSIASALAAAYPVALTEKATETTTITMTADDAENVTIPQYAKVVLDLKSHVLSSATSNQEVIHVSEYASLEVKDKASIPQDHSFTKNEVTGLLTWDESSGIYWIVGGCITGGANSGIYCSWYSELILTSGTIVGNTTTSSGGGIRTCGASRIFLNGGKIVGNVAANEGGGVFVGSQQVEAVLAGTTITENFAARGGGVSVDYDTTFEMLSGRIEQNCASEYGGGLTGCESYNNLYGGTITANYAPVGGGVMAYGIYGLNLGKNIDISSNYKAMKDTELNTWMPLFQEKSNLGIYTSDTWTNYITPVTSGTNELANTTPIGVTLYKRNASSNLVPCGGVFTESAAGTLSKLGNFTSDVDEYNVLFEGDDEGEGVLALRKYVCYIDDNDGIFGNETHYDSVTKALATVTDNTPTTIVMEANDEENFTVPADRTITLDLRDYVISSAETNKSVITNHGTLTIKDATGGRTHEFKVAAGTKNLWELVESDGDYILAGGCITGGNVQYSGGGIFNDGNLTLTSGNIVGNAATGNSNYAGGGVYNDTDATFTMNGGNIVGNDCDSSSSRGGGVCNYDGVFYFNAGTIGNNLADAGGGVYNSGDMIQSDGAIVNNTASNHGGGVYNHGNYTMTGGSINENTAPYWGGGVDEMGTSFVMTGGEIKGNVITKTTMANNGGAGMYHRGASVTLGGTAVIKNNTFGSNANNLYLKTGKTVALDSTLLPTTGFSVGVTAQNDKPYVFSGTGGTTTIRGLFHSDDTNFEVVLCDNTALKLAKPITHKHCVCGSGDSCGDDHDATTGYEDWEKTDSLPTTAGYYVLTDDVTLTTTWYPADGTVLCLNGYDIAMAADMDVINVQEGFTFTLTDCSSVNPGKITHDGDYTGCGMSIVGGTFNMYNGNIYKNEIPDTLVGAGVLLMDGSTFNMYGGKVDGNTAEGNGAGVDIHDKDSVFNLHDGEICYNTSTDEESNGGGVACGGTFNMYGGKINGNQSGGTGGGIASVVKSDDKGGIVNIYDGIICYNTSAQGGGVSVEQGATLNVAGGEFYGNSSTGTGGGAIGNAGTFTMTGGKIHDNRAYSVTGSTFGSIGGGIGNIGVAEVTGGEIYNNFAYLGGGIGNAGYGAAATLTVKNVKIYNNIAQSYGGGVVSLSYNKDSSLTMENCTVTGNKASLGGGIVVTAAAGNLAKGKATGSILDSTITGNGAIYGGGVFNAIAEMTIGGETEIKSNFIAVEKGAPDAPAIDDGPVAMDAPSLPDFTLTDVPSNLAVYGEVMGLSSRVEFITEGEDALANTTPIGLSLYDPSSAKLIGGLVSTSDEKTESFVQNGKFVSDSDAFLVRYNEAEKSVELAQIVCKIGDKPYVSVTEALATVTDNTPTTILMVANDAENFTVPANRTITLDLDGYVITAAGEGSVITNKGTLTLVDNNSKSQAHNYNVVDGLYCLQAGQGEVELIGGAIIGGNADIGGGIYNEGDLTLLSVKIVGNKANLGGGVACKAGATLTVGGTVYINGNTDKEADAKPSNLYLATSQTATVSTDVPLTGAALVGVLTEAIPVIGTPVALTGTNVADYKVLFIDNTGKYKVINKDNVVYLSAHEHEWSFEAEDATITATCANSDGLAEGDCTETLTIACGDYMYDSTAHKATLSATSIGGETVSQDDIVYYSGNDKLDGAPEAVGDYTATITVKGVTASVEYSISQRPLLVAGNMVDGKTYDGSTFANITLGAVEGLVAGDDVQVLCTATFDDANVGEDKHVSIVYEITGADAENYEKPADDEGTASIYPRELVITADNKASLLNKDLVPLTYTMTGTLVGEDIIVGFLQCEADKTVCGEYDITQGSLSVNDNAKDNYTITFNKGTYTVAEKSTPTAAEFVMNAEDVIYDGETHYADVAVKDGVLGMGEFTVHYFVDGTEVEEPIEVGTYEVRVNVVDDPDSLFYAAENIVLGSFKILPKELTKPTDIPSQTYTGEEIRPEVIVKDGDKVLEEGVDYTLSYEGNINSADAKVVVTGKGNYTGEFTLPFDILCTFTFEVNGGNAVEPQVVKVGTLASEPIASKDGAIFAGWYTDEALENAFDFNTPVTANTTLFAKWQIVEVVINAPEGVTVDKESLDAAMKKIRENASYADAGNIKLEIVIEKTISDEDMAIVNENLKADGMELFDAKLILTVDGESSDYGDLNETLVKITYNFDFTGKINVRVYRVHKGELGELTTAANGNGEYVTFNKDAGTIDIMAMKYSAFVITYDLEKEPTDTEPTDTEPTVEPTNGPTDTEPTAAPTDAPKEAPKTGDNSNAALWVGIVTLCGVVLILGKKREQEQA